jgi:hypothetical protein
MKPYELIAALMLKEGIGPLPLAKKIGKPGLQSQIQKFKTGGVLNPERTTAVPLAAYFKIPTDAIYDEKIATAIAKEWGVEPPPIAATTAKAKGRSGSIDDDAKKMAEEFAKMSLAERKRLRQLMESIRAPGETTGERQMTARLYTLPRRRRQRIPLPLDAPLAQVVSINSTRIE